jgi:hypothetical protein
MITPASRRSRSATIDIRIDLRHVLEDVVNGVVGGLRGLGRKRGS